MGGNNTEVRIEPIDRDLQKEVIQQTFKFIELSESIYQTVFAHPKILFDLTGRTAGMYRLKDRIRSIRYNPYIFAKYYKDNLNNTVPHEVAHYVCDLVYGSKRIRPHGSEWKSLMRAFNVEPQVTANYDLTGIPTRQYQRFDYQCQCRTHQLTTVRHKWIQSNSRRYYCKFCKEPLSLKNSEREKF